MVQPLMPRLPVRPGATVAIALAAMIGPAAGQSAHAEVRARIDALVAAYPDHLERQDEDTLVWRDGTRMMLDDGRAKSHEEKLEDADIEDMMSQAYPVGSCSFDAPARNFDPGRIRNDAFFRKMYGGTSRQVRAHLTPVVWFGTTVRVTRINAIDRKIEAVARDLAALDPEAVAYLRPSGGTFNWRTIAGTQRLSVHSFGAAIDINTGHGDYWRWQGGKPGDVKAYRNRIPKDVVEVFERHGFIWGGKWYHYDTMHFEYRPELLMTAARCPPDR